MPVIPSPSDLKIIRLYICLGTWVTVVEREKNKAMGKQTMLQAFIPSF